MPFPEIHPALDRALAAQGYAEPTPVQAAVLEPEARGRDLLVSAQTGSGKTVAFGLAMAAEVLREAERLEQAAAPLALIVAPTRELAMQVSRELDWLYAQTGARIVSCVGGMDPRREQRLLEAGCHIVVGTPGRLHDHLDRGNLDVSGLRVVVLDEADEMLDLGFREDLEAILDTTPAERRTLLFSATIAREIAALARRYQGDALRIDTVRRDEPHADIDYRVIRIAPQDVEHAVVNVLRYFESPGALVFCSTREAVRRLYGALRERGFSAVALSGELSQKERSDALQALRDGHARVCVATDVAARGLDLPDLGLVIHAEPPVNRAGLLHRSGRTGRAGRKGVSILLATYPRMRRVEQLLRDAGVRAEWSGPPTAEEIRAKDQERLLADPLLTEPAAEDELEQARALLESRTAEAAAVAFLRLYRSRLPAPEDLQETPPPPRREDRAERYPKRERPEHQRPERGERPARRDYGSGSEGAAWFRVAVGRSNKADPKWLIPLICRMGQVTKAEIGQIRIFDRETKFEIVREAAEGFTAALAQATQEERNRIEPAGAPSPRREGPYADKPGKPPRGAKPDRPARPFKGKSNPAPRPFKGKPDASSKPAGPRGAKRKPARS